MKERSFQKLTDLMALLVFGIFALCVLLVLLSGADVYRRLEDAGQSQYHRRTAVQYIITRVRQGQSVHTEDFSGVEALVFPETINGRDYVTRVYCHDGYLRELFTPEAGSFSPEDGEKLIEMADLSLSMEENLLNVQLTLPDGSIQNLKLHLRSGEGAVS